MAKNKIWWSGASIQYAGKCPTKKYLDGESPEINMRGWWSWEKYAEIEREPPTCMVT